MTMKQASFSLILLILIQACAPIKKNTDTVIIDRVRSYKLVCNKKEDIYMLYGGDYWFHDLKKNQTLNWNDDYMESIKKDKHKKELLFIGQTFIEPYHSSMGMIYRNANANEQAKMVKDYMRKVLLAENMVLSQEQFGLYNYSVLTYDLYDTKLRVYARYREYFSDIKDKDVMRISFWSMETCDSMKRVIMEGDYHMLKRSPVQPSNDE